MVESASVLFGRNTGRHSGAWVDVKRLGILVARPYFAL